MSSTLDANILVYASNTSDPLHAPASALVQRLAEGPELVYLFWPTLLGYLRIVLTVSCGAALVSYCQWAFETADAVRSAWPFYELSIVPLLTALLRYALVLEQGRGAAPEDVFASDRVLQLMGVAWAVIFGLAVYVR